MMNEMAVTWLTNRGLDPELAVRLGWGNGKDSGTLAIPFVRGGETVNFKYRTLDKKRFWQDSEGVKIWWNWDVVTDLTLANMPLIITEGECDGLAAIQCGFQRTISVPDGAPAREVDQDAEKFSYIEHFPIPADTVDKVILAVDNDEAGQVLLRELSLRIGRHRCWFVKFPDGFKDINQLLHERGEADVVSLIAGAAPLPIKGLYTLDDLPRHPERVPYPTGIPGLDDHYTLRFGELTVITGIPGHGKTTFALEVACRVADSYGWMSAIASFELPPSTELVPALRQWRAGKPWPEVGRDDRTRINTWVKDHFVFIADESSEPDELADLAWIKERIEGAVLRHNAKLVIIDPWNEIDHNRFRDETETEYTGRAIKELKRLASRLDIHLIIVAHPVKMQRRNNGGETFKPTLYDIAGSAHFTNKPDVGIVVWREGDTTEIGVRKVRFQKSVGKPGSSWLFYNTHLGRFEGAPAPGETD